MGNVTVPGSMGSLPRIAAGLSPGYTEIQARMSGMVSRDVLGTMD
jgi:hypothetical protein